MGKVKYTDDFVINYFNSKQHIELIDIIREENKNPKIKYICKLCGSCFTSDLRSFMYKKVSKCKSCSTKEANKSKWNVDYIRSFIESNSTCKLISNEYINAREYNLDILCKCGEVFTTSFEQFKNNNKRQCNKCGRMNGMMKSLKDKDEIMAKVKKVLGEDFIIVNENDYKNMDTKLTIKHLICNHVFERTSNKILNSKQISCGFCGDNVYLNDENAKYKLSLITNEFTFVKIEKDEFLMIEHKECGCKMVRSLSQLRKSSGALCYKCKSSKGVRAITNYLQNNNIDFIKEYKFDDCRFKNKLPFDFYLPQYNTLIEYDGKQHYDIIEYYGGLDGFIDRRIRDSIKNIYCKNNNIQLIRIPYWEFDNKTYIEKLNNTLIPR